jgi:hypothetical protein
VKVKIIKTVVKGNGIKSIPKRYIGQEFEATYQNVDKSIYVENCGDKDGTGCTFFNGEYEIIEP